MPSGNSMGLCAIFGEVPVFLGCSQKKKIMIRELFLMSLSGASHVFCSYESASLEDARGDA
jgi:hypothetical protein